MTVSTSFDRTVVVLAVILAIALVPIGTSASVGQSQSGSAGGDDGVAFVQAETPEADTTVTRIAVDENGTARWSVTVRTRLENESDVDDYEAFQEQFRADKETYVGQFERRITGVVSNAETTTGRNMTASSFRLETSIQEVPRRWGTVTYSFTWTNFAAVDGQKLVVGDVFEGGFYLDDDDRLQIAPPEGYRPTATSPSPDERDGTMVVWAGPQNFADQHPTTRFEPTSSPVDGDSGESSSSDSPFVVAGSILFVAVVGVAIFVASQPDRRQQLRSKIPLPFGGVSESDAPAPVDGRTSSDDDVQAPTPTDPPSASPDLVTDEGQVQSLLERNGGRMRQAAIAEKLDWSASKTSRVISGMAEENTVEKLRIGRENVIDLVENADEGGSDASGDPVAPGGE